MKSMSPSSAHWQVLEHQDRRRDQAIRSKNVRQAANSSSLPPLGSLEAQRPAASRGPIRASLGRIGHELLDRCRINFRRASPGSSASFIRARSRTISARAQ